MLTNLTNTMWNAVKWGNKDLCNFISIKNVDNRRLYKIWIQLNQQAHPVHTSKIRAAATTGHYVFLFEKGDIPNSLSNAH